MKHLLSTLFATAIITASVSIPTQAQQTKILTPDKHNDYGLVYSLPVTALKITVTAEKQTRIAGPYANYAKKYLAASSPISESGEKWTITDVRVTPVGVADPGQQYIMQLKPGATTFISVSGDGMLLSINKEEEDMSARGVVNKPKVEKFTGKEYLQYVDEDFIASQSKAKQAEMLAESIMDVRDSYLSLTRGTADTMPVDGKQLELMLNSLKEQERAMTAAFIGCSYSETVCETFTLIPDEEGIYTPFRFSDFKGFCDAEDYAGAPVNLTLKLNSEGKIPTDNNGKDKEMPKDAVRYCVPGNASVSLSFDGKKLYSANVDFAQFGVVFGLAPNLFTDKKQPSYATFNPATGAIETLGTISARE